MPTPFVLLLLLLFFGIAMIVDDDLLELTGVNADPIVYMQPLARCLRAAFNVLPGTFNPTKHSQATTIDTSL